PSYPLFHLSVEFVASIRTPGFSGNGKEGTTPLGEKGEPEVRIGALHRAEAGKQRKGMTVAPDSDESPALSRLRIDAGRIDADRRRVHETHLVTVAMGVALHAVARRQDFLKRRGKSRLNALVRKNNAGQRQRHKHGDDGPDRARAAPLSEPDWP